MDAAPAKQRRWFRFSLRTLLVVVTALCLWLAIQVNAARRQHEAVAAILAGGGYVTFDHEISGAPNPGPIWLREFIGPDYFRTVVAVGFQTGRKDRVGSAMYNSGFGYILNVANRTSRRFGTISITETTLDHIRNLSDLEILDLRGTGVSDAGLKYLKGLAKLNFLYMDETHVTPAGLDALRAALPKTNVIGP